MGRRGMGVLLSLGVLACAHLTPVGDVAVGSSGAIEVDEKEGQLFRLTGGIDCETTVACGGDLTLKAPGSTDLTDCRAWKLRTPVEVLFIATPNTEEGGWVRTCERGGEAYWVKRRVKEKKTPPAPPKP